MTKVQSLVRRNLLLGGAVALLLVYLIARPSKTSAVSRDSLPAAFPEVSLDAAQEVYLSRQVPGTPAIEEIRLERVGAADWVVASAHGYPAHGDKVRGFLEDLQRAKGRGLVTTQRASFEEYAPEEGWLRVAVRDAEGKNLTEFDLGQQRGWRESYVRTGDGDKARIERVEGLDSFKVRLDLEAWVEARLWPSLTLPAANRIDLFQRDEQSTLMFVAEEREVPPPADAPEGTEPQVETAWLMKAPREGDADRNAVEGLLRSFSGMRLSGIVGSLAGGATEAEFGLDAPSYRAIVYATVDGEDQRYVLRVGSSRAATDGETETWYVRRGDDPWVYEVSAGSVGDLRQEASAYDPAPVAEEPEAPAPGEPVDVPPGGEPPAGDTTGSPDGEPPAVTPLAPVVPDEPPLPPETPPGEPDEPDAPDAPDEPR